MLCIDSRDKSSSHHEQMLTLKTCETQTVYLSCYDQHFANKLYKKVFDEGLTGWLTHLTLFTLDFCNRHKIEKIQKVFICLSASLVHFQTGFSGLKSTPYTTQCANKSQFETFEILKWGKILRLKSFWLNVV